MINKKLVTSVSLAALLVLPLIVSAVVIPAAPGGNLTVVTALDLVLGFMWIIFVAAFFIFLFIASFFFLSAQGEPEGIAKARQALIWAVVSLVIAIVSFSIPKIITTLFQGA
ncbi:MAG: hypothetical protein A3C50_02480 [Candidatus Staskawiczbacteria bacterium RIFCSPHIGHO2_02_FULL_43_16]|uniref:Uncharacterized protein n=1 Tax=Candidatus Staskawiczbacteria bacterium RIFCSPHIGHO2_01_FULL_41_41 TaxID=1802203 RepID=A0A1G2HVJ6_9BACT|nr:MAG: hypothetical protein A2822_01605 [Candidatus Staskawiczbacteria bacterium RIFCSPHIGHO2_01_FULL_41_41]OGZ68154.1 MAG: hypothetical protein A3C50_02480 [Candidatus Staskawiczbacteria bacterium RIFCSPHIGHO2_02_FULL_43_16]OGZ74944.1 MAG: hypothetical protein A3A12_03875 [Candidatus Staskawiczbacteria bacterium RIFCSPLOWO2_01_FULL_43_17b]